MRMSFWMFLSAIFFTLIGTFELSTAMSTDFVLFSAVVFLSAACICRAIEETR